MWLLAILALLTGCAPRTAKLTLDRDDTGLVEFTTAGSLVATDDGRLTAGPPLTLSGDLEIPPGPGPFPAVVLMHGCAGIGSADREWVSVLRTAGYATFVLDSFTGRGLSDVCVDAGALYPSQRMPDAYGALRILSTHPAIDPSRIALMGFSHGGIATVLSSTQWAHDRFVEPGRPGFRAFIAFYPYCNWSFPEMERISAPLRIYSGSLDDWTPAQPCELLVERLRVTGYDAAITVYAGARHSFDRAGPPIRPLPRVLNAAACAPRLTSILGPMENGDQLASCLHEGATVGSNPQAAAEARRAVLREFGALLR